MPEKKFFISTPLYYVNDVPHVGHAYATVGADVLARFKRAQGKEVYLLTGTDEHGQKIEKAAAEKGGLTPQAFADSIVPHFKEAWRVLGISYDRFIRTTDADHKLCAQRFWQKVAEAGFIEKRQYEGWYCIHEETFHSEKELHQPGNLCPECDRPASRMKEENYFFLMTAFADKLRAFLAANSDLVQPASRRNEVMASYLDSEDGVHDISISRNTLKWGIPVPGDPDHVIYVWFDALINYLTVTGWPDPSYTQLWPADVHIIGKEILRFHAVLWPSMLMAAGVEPPKRVFGTGHIVVDGKKMSKSLGNVVDPIDWSNKFGAEVLRYYLLREVPFGQDGNISEAGIEGRYNAELANGLGNLISRSTALCEKNAVVFGAWAPETADKELLDAANSMRTQYLRTMEKLHFHETLEAVNVLIRAANKYVDERAPWTLAKDKTPEGAAALAHVLYAVAESARLCCVALAPFMPQTAEKCLRALGFGEHALLDAKTKNQGPIMETLLVWGGIPIGVKLAKAEPLFPRREAVKA